MNKWIEPVHPGARRRTRIIIVVVVAAALVAATAVAYFSFSSPSPPAGAACATCPPSSLPPASASACPPGTLRDSVTHNTMTNNGLSKESLSANQALLDLLAKSTLDATLFGGPNNNLLKEPYAPELVEYIVSCALDPCKYVPLPPVPDDPTEGKLDYWRQLFPAGFPGELGLCDSNAPGGEAHWDVHTPTPGCLERVSACVIARVNAVEARVPISLRGDGLPGTLDRVWVETQFRENHGTPIQSFKRCDQMCLWGDAERRNCDWQPRLVGQCVRGAKNAPAPSKVKLQLSALAPVPRVRICKGIYGCDDLTPGAGAVTAPVYSHGYLATFPPHYGGQLLEHTTSAGIIEFDCPDNGPLTEDRQMRTGYYSVMLGNPDPSSSVNLGGDLKLLPLLPPASDPYAIYNRYPAQEHEIFSYREGGFYGNIFPTPSHAPCDQDGVYACSSKMWTLGAAMITDRLCAGSMGANPLDHCFANSPIGCDLGNPVCVPTLPEPLAYDTCPGCAQTYEEPYTVYLNHPCDMFASEAQCGPLLNDEVAADIGLRTRTDPPSNRPPAARAR